MKALTLSQPWATLHVAPCELTIDNLPAKRIESRGWGWRAPFDCAIHAGKGIDKGSRHYVSDGTRFREPFARYLQASGYSTLDCWQRGYRENFEHDDLNKPMYSIAEETHLNPLPLGAMIGFTTYIGVVRGRDILKGIKNGAFPKIEEDFGFYDEPPVDDEHTEKRWGFISENTIHFYTPIITRGFQKLWDVPTSVKEEIDARLRVATVALSESRR